METAAAPALCQMSLHEVTTRFGEAGLHDRLDIEIDQLVWSDHDKQLAHRAGQLAIAIHQGQPRGQLPYSTHPLRVANRVINHLGVTDYATVVASLLHDSVEDQAKRLARLTTIKQSTEQATALAYLEQEFGWPVSDYVDHLTMPKRPADFPGSKLDWYGMHITATMMTHPAIRPIKLSDFIDNFAGLKYSEDRAMAKRLAAKYKPLAALMIELAQDPGTPLSPAGRLYAVGALQRASRRSDDLLTVA